MVIALLCCSTRTRKLRSNNRQSAAAENLGSSRYENKKETHKVSSMLLNQDSNPDRQNQNL